MTDLFIFRKTPEDFKTYFYPEYGYFLKEGVCGDVDFQEPLSKLLYWETSKTLNKELSSFDEYISRSPPEQKEIYYLCTASREVGFQSPYYEAFQKAGREVIFIYSAIDEFSLQQINTYEGRKIVSIEKSDIDLGKKKNKDGKLENGKEEEEDDPKDTSIALSNSEKTEFADWFKSLFPGKVESVKPTNRLSTSPAMITNHESGAMRRMMKMVDQQDVNFTAEPLPEVEIEFNPQHEIIVHMFRIRRSDPIFAKVCAEQVYDNCLVAAGLMDDSRTMLGRLNDILLVVVKAIDSGNSNNANKVDSNQETTVVDEGKELLEAQIVEPDDRKDKVEQEMIDDSTKVAFDGKIDDESSDSSDDDDSSDEDETGETELKEVIKQLQEEEGSDSDSDENHSSYEERKGKWKKKQKDKKKVKQEKEEKPTEGYRFQKNKLHKEKNINDMFMRKKEQGLFFTKREKELLRNENKDFVKKTRKSLNDDIGDGPLHEKQRKIADAWLKNELGYENNFKRKDIFGFEGDSNKNKKKSGNRKKRRSHKRRK